MKASWLSMWQLSYLYHFYNTLHWHRIVQLFVGICNSVSGKNSLSTDDPQLALEDIAQLLFRWLINVFIFLIERAGGEGRRGEKGGDLGYCFCLNLSSFKSCFQNYFNHFGDRRIFIKFLFLSMSYFTLTEIHLHILMFFKKEVSLSLLQLRKPIKPPQQPHHAV